MLVKIGAGDRFKINGSKVSHETIDGETLMVNLDNGNYYSVLGIGVDIWSLIASGAALADIVEVIDHRYEGARVDIEQSIDKFVAELQEEGLIVHEKGGAHVSLAGVDIRAETKAGAKRPTFEAPILNKYADMRDLLLLDPIHEVDDAGWPTPKPSADE